MMPSAALAKRWPRWKLPRRDGARPRSTACNEFVAVAVRDGDRRLVGEGSDQLDLLLGERPHLGARQCQKAGRDAFAQHRHGEYRAVAAQSLALSSFPVLSRIDVPFRNAPLERKRVVPY